MACITPNLTIEDIRTELFDKKAKIRPVENQIAEVSRAYLNTIRDIFTTINFPVKDLPIEVQKTVIADIHDFVQRYAIKGELTPAVKKRITDDVTRKFIKQKGRDIATKINREPDNEIKANFGTKLHTAMQDIMELLIETSDSKSLIKNSSIKSYGYEKKSLKAIKEALGVSDKYFNELVRHQREILKSVLDIQNQIDPNDLVQVFTEQFVYDERRDLGGTADFLVVFSDNSYGHLDYKSMVPYEYTTTNNPNTGLIEITDPNWIPSHKYEDFNLQLPTTNNILETKFGLGNNRFTRVIPIQVHFHTKPGKTTKGKRLTNKVKQVSIGSYGKDSEGNMYLGAIPVQEKTGIKDLDRKLQQLITIKTNEQIELANTTDSNKKDALKKSIAFKQRMINKIIIERDISFLRFDADNIIKRYFKDNQLAVDINNETINNKANPNYLTDREVREFLQQLEVYLDILNSSMHHMKELGITQKELEEYKNKVARLVMDLGSLLTQIQSISMNRTMSETERAAIKDYRVPGFWGKMFNNLSEQMHPVFRKFTKILHVAQNKRRLDSQKMEKDIKKQVLSVEDWARKNGKSLSKTYDLIYDENTGNLHGKFKQEFWKALQEAREKNDRAWLNKHLVLKEDAKQIKETTLEQFKMKFPTEAELKTWAQRHDFRNAVRDPYLWKKYYKINPNIAADSQYYSDGYKFLLKSENKALFDFWNFYRDKMKEALKMIGMEYDTKLGASFLPWIRANMLEQVMQDGWNIDNIMENVKALTQVREDDTMFGDPVIKGKTNPVTGEPIYAVPRYYTNPLKNNKGRIDAGLKSRDLGKALFVFYDMALNYNYMYNEVEPHVEAFKDILAQEGIKPAQIKGKDIKDKGGFLVRLTGKQIGLVEQFESAVKTHVYGLRIQDTSPEKAKFWTQLKAYQTIQQLALSPLVWAGNFTQVKGNLIFNGLNGYHYSFKDMIDTQKMKDGIKGRDAKDLYYGLVGFFEPSLTKKQVQIKQLTSRRSLKWISMDTAFWGFRAGEESISHDVLVNILKNYGYNKNGELVRKKYLKGEKTLFEKSKIVDGNIVIEGIIDEKGNVNIEEYTKIRDLSVGITRQITGQVNPEDVAQYQSILMWNLMSSFKSWIPGMWNARGAKLQYYAPTNSIMEGKYQVLASDMDRGGRKLVAFIGLEVIPRLAKFVALSPFMTFVGTKNLYKINEERARQQFEKFKDDYRNDPEIQNLSFEDFIEFKQGQLRSLAAELTAIFTMVSFLLLLGMDWDDDGEPDYKSNVAFRTLYRIINRGRRELAFFISPNDWYDIVRSPIPVTGLALDALAWFRNFRDETGDVLFGEDERTGMNKIMFGANRGKDEKPVFFETLRFIPGNKLLKMLEIFEAYQASET